MERYLCIHGHFYQPPRENPWLEAIEIQDSAYPYHDWNERITSECYAPNAASRILDGKKRIMHIVSNYSKISFNIGPTLLSWLESRSPRIYTDIIEADRESIHNHSGHGTAMAQAYNHLIMPLANSRDKYTQVVWGIRDFKYRFGRDPEGMWLPETAVDLETLDIMAELGIKFTVLAPRQAYRIRRIGDKGWKDLSNSGVDPSRAYKCVLPSGRSIALFFYDGPISQAVAFEGLLKSGKEFAHRLMSGFSDKREGAQLIHIATDGESYGHHHRFGDMALAYALDYIERENLARITNYGEFLELHPPEYEVEIHENSSWSCAHGVERWRADCGCSTGSHPKWNQQWRKPLRDALDWLKEKAAALYEEHAAGIFHDPWKARNRYIFVVLDRSEENVSRFFKEHCHDMPSGEARTRALKLLELQRHAMLMYTSCGWFFDDISGIETLQIMQYAGRVIQLAKELFDRSMGEEFKQFLGKARSNMSARGNGADIYERHVTPRVVDLYKVTAHYAISSLFEEYPEDTDIYCYHVTSKQYQKEQSGKTEVVAGHVNVSSIITGESEDLSFGLLHLGEHDFTCGVRTGMSESEYNAMSKELIDTFRSGSFANLVRLIDRDFGTYHYTLQSLFADEQRSILETIIQETLLSFESSYRQIYEDNRILMGFLSETGIPVPQAFRTATAFTLNHDLKAVLKAEGEAGAVRELLDEFERWGIEPDAVELEFAFRRTLEHQMKTFYQDPSNTPMLLNLDRLLDIALSLPFEHNLWVLQNLYYRLAGTAYTETVKREGDDSQWATYFRAVGEKLNFNLTAVLKEVE